MSTAEELPMAPDKWTCTLLRATWTAPRVTVAGKRLQSSTLGASTKAVAALNSYRLPSVAEGIRYSPNSAHSAHEARVYSGAAGGTASASTGPSAGGRPRRVAQSPTGFTTRISHSWPLAGVPE